MTFLNATLLLGALAAAVPIILHWLSRQEPKQVVLPSVRFLTQRLTTQQSNLRVRRWWLLAMRMLAILAVACLLARPMIASSTAVTWGWIGGLALVAVVVLVLASIAWVRGLGRWLAGVLAGVAILMLFGSVFWGMATWATAETPPLAGGRPVAIAILIDNSPSAARRRVAESDDQAAGNTPAENSIEASGGTGLLAEGANDVGPVGGLPAVAGTRLAEMIRRAESLIDRLPVGSRVAVIDRTGTPVAFSLDVSAAKQRLSGLQVTAVPVPMRQRLDAAAELVRSSDLPDRQVVVISDLCAAAWASLSPSERSGRPAAQWFRRRFGVSAGAASDNDTTGQQLPAGTALQTGLDTGPDTGLQTAAESATEQGNGAERPVGLTVFSLLGDKAGGSDARLNRWLSTPRWIDATPPPGVSIPVVCTINLEERRRGGLLADSEETAGANGGSPTSRNLTAQLSLYESDPRYPVVRDGQVVRPPLRLVDRASVSVSPVAVDEQIAAGQSEVVLTLPPLDRGTAHAVIQLIGEDGFSWDDTRYLTLALPPPPRVLVVADQIEEANVLAAAMTAPQPIDDQAAGYRVDRVGYKDLPAVRLSDYRAVVLADPPLSVGGPAAESEAGSDGRTGWDSEQIREVSRFVQQGGGLWVLLGPSLSSGGRLEKEGEREQPIDWLPPLVRLWRSPAPGTFLQTIAASHPSLRGMAQLSQPPTWSEFRIRRYWQVTRGGEKSDAVGSRAAEDDDVAAAGQSGRPDAWQVVMRYAGSDHPALMVRGRVAVMTTPLPALGKSTRSWNELFSGADAWPAFVMVRSITAWLTGVTDQQLTLLAGRAAVLQPTVSTTDATTADAGVTADAADDGDDGKQDLQAVSASPSNDVESASRLRLFPPGDAVPESVPWEAATDPTTSGQRLAKEATLMLRQTDLPGTYFLRGEGVWSGYSVNLDPVWSSSRLLGQADLTAWFGADGWQWAEDVATMKLGGVGGADPPVSVHGPLTWLAVAVFLLEQLLSSRFYGRVAREPA